MVLGVLPLSLLGRTTWLVLWVNKAMKFTPKMLKEMRRTFAAHSQKLGGHLVAEAKNSTNERFLQFFGFEKLDTQHDSVLYEWRG